MDKIVCTTLMVTVMGPKAATTKRIHDVEDLLRDTIQSLNVNLRPTGFLLKPEADHRCTR